MEHALNLRLAARRLKQSKRLASDLEFWQELASWRVGGGRQIDQS
jgi:spermidine synthase